jgi:hypothetical protein|tara:strand:+ start:10 stop:390 length:381 start_codon:yes stop_codon:yes gene_type:complete
MGRMSRTKGAAYEREIANHFRDFYGRSECRRGIQTRSGGKEAADVLDAIPGCHLELKRVERLNLSAAMKQAVDDSQSQDLIPVVVSRKSREESLVTIRLSDLEAFVRAVELILLPSSGQSSTKLTG